MQKNIKIIKKNWHINHLLVHDHSKVHQSSWHPVLVIFFMWKWFTQVHHVTVGMADNKTGLPFFQEASDAGYQSP